MTLHGEHAETCPVSLEFLTALYRAEPDTVGDLTRDLSGPQKVELAVYCYGRAHFRELGLTIAATCDVRALGRFAGVMGQVLSAQSRGRIQEFGLDGVRSSSLKRKVTLARAAA